MFKPIWKGYITFGLVNIPITLYSAEKIQKLRLHFIDSRDKSRIHYVRVNENTGKEVPWEKVARGYEYEKGNFILLEDKVLKTVAGENTKILNIEGFIEAEHLTSLEVYKPYYIVPDKNNEKGYVILRETLKQTGKIGIAQVIIHTRQHLAALIPYENALLLNLVHYPEEIRKTSEFDFPNKALKTYKVTASEMKVAKKLIDLMTMKWDPSLYKDEYQLTLQKWVKEKLRTHKTPKTRMEKKTAPSKHKVINFVDLLKKSLEEKQGRKLKKVKSR